MPLTYRTDSGKDVQVDEDVMTDILALKAKVKNDSATIEELTAAKTNLEEKIKQLEADTPDDKDGIITTLKAQVEAQNQLIEKLKQQQGEVQEQQKIDEAVKERLSLIENAKAIDNEFKADGLSNKEIKLHVLKKTDMMPDIPEGTRTDSVDDVVINARYDAAINLVKKQSVQPSSDGSSEEREDSDIYSGRQGLYKG